MLRLRFMHLVFCLRRDGDHSCLCLSFWVHRSLARQNCALRMQDFIASQVLSAYRRSAQLGGTSWNADVEHVWKCTKCTTRSSCLLCVCRTLERPDQDPQLDAFSMVLSLAYLRMSDVWAKWTATFWGSGQWHCSKCCQSVILVTFRCKMGLRWACWPCWSNSKNVDWDYVAMWWYVMCHLQVMLLIDVYSHK